MKLLRIFLALALSLAMAGAAGAALIAESGIAGYGAYTNSASLIINDTFVAEETEWTNDGCVYSDEPVTPPYFVVDLGAQYYVQDIVVQVDCNDTYKIDYSIDNSTYTNLLTILDSYGEIDTGMDTMSTVSGDGEYVNQIEFSQVAARYLKIICDAGDNRFSISEMQAFGDPVPVPGAVWLLGSGLGLLAWRRHRS